MKFITLIDNCKSALAIAEKALGKSFNLPILSHFLIETDTNRIRVAATNLEFAISAYFPGKVEALGKITVPAKTLFDFLSQNSDDKAEVTTEAKTLKVSSSHHRATLQGMDAEEFPIIPKIKQDVPILIDAGNLKTALLQTIGAASTAEIRPELMSVLVSYEPGKAMRLVATDSFRLAEKTVPEGRVKSSLNNKIAALIPLRTAQEVAKISQEKSGEVRIFIDANQIEFRWEDAELISRLLEGEFPEYSSVVPREFAAHAVVDRKRVIEALKVSGVFSGKLNDVRVSFHPENHYIALKAADAPKGENETRIEAEVEGKATEITFNFRYLIDGFESIAEEKVYFGAGEETSPAMIKPEKDTSFFYIAMPIRL